MVQIFVAIPLQTLINCEMILMWLYVDMICISTDATILSCIGCPLDHTCARASDTFLQEHSVDGVFQQLQQSSPTLGAPWTTPVQGPQTPSCKNTVLMVISTPATILSGIGCPLDHILCKGLGHLHARTQC